MTLPEHNTRNFDVGRQSTANKDGMKSININFYTSMLGVPFSVYLNAVTATIWPSRCRLVLPCNSESSSNSEQEASLTCSQDDGATRVYCASLIQSNICHPFNYKLISLPHTNIIPDVSIAPYYITVDTLHDRPPGINPIDVNKYYYYYYYYYHHYLGFILTSKLHDTQTLWCNEGCPLQCVLACTEPHVCVYKGYQNIDYSGL
jgi:hypothetical protein